MLELDQIFNEPMLAVIGVVAVLAALIASFMEWYAPVVPTNVSSIFQTDENTKKKTVEELQELESRDEKLPLISETQLSENRGQKGASAWVACKGVVYDVSANEVYKSDGGYNCFAGKDATVALAKMEFEMSGQPGWRSKLNHEQLCVLEEWCKWYAQRYPKIGYLETEYAISGNEQQPTNESKKEK